MLFRSYQILYICVGGKGTEGNWSVTGVGGYNGGGHGGGTNGYYTHGSGGSGATHICLQDGVLKDLKNAYENNQLLMVAGGQGGKVGPYGIGGYGGGIEGGKPNCLYSVTNFPVATQSSGNAFGLGQTGRTGTNNTGGYEGGGGGGGGLYGGYAPQNLGPYTNHTGGGGSGYVNAKLVNSKTIAGNETFLSPSGVSETGHAGNGAALITWLP